MSETNKVKIKIIKQFVSLLKIYYIFSDRTVFTAFSDIDCINRDTNANKNCMSETEGVETKGIDFKVKTQSGTEYELKNVLPDTTVLQIKEQVAKQDGTLTPVQIKLLYRGKVLGVRLVLPFYIL